MTLSHSDASSPFHPTPTLSLNCAHVVQYFFAFALLMNGESLDVFYRGEAILLHWAGMGEDESEWHFNWYIQRCVRV